MVASSIIQKETILPSIVRNGEAGLDNSDLSTVPEPSLVLPSAAPQLSSKVSEILSSASVVLPSSVPNRILSSSISHYNEADCNSSYPTSSIPMTVRPTNASLRISQTTVSSATSYQAATYNKYNYEHHPDYVAASSSTTVLEDFPAKKTPEYASGYNVPYTPVYVEEYSVKPSNPAKVKDYTGLSAPTLLSSYPEATATKASDVPDYENRPGGSKTTSTATVTYVDVCETGYTTVTATHIITYVPGPSTPAAANPTSGGEYSIYPPLGFEVTTKICNQGCGTGPVTVTVTIPVTKYSQYPSTQPIHPDNNSPLSPTSNPKITTLSKMPIPASAYPAQQPSSPLSGVTSPAQPSSPAVASGKPSAGYAYPASNGTVRYSTGAASPTASQTGYSAPQFTGAAPSTRVGGGFTAASMLGLGSLLLLLL